MGDCKCTGEKQRYCFRKDDSGHDYLVPWELRDRFRELVEDEDTWEEFENEFGGMLMNIHPNFISFTDPKEER